MRESCALGLKVLFGHTSEHALQVRYIVVLEPQHARPREGATVLDGVVRVLRWREAETGFRLRVKWDARSNNAICIAASRVSKAR